MLFVDGFVHCDLHSGNLYCMRHGDVVVLDAGFAVQLSEGMRQLFGEFFLNMALGRGVRCGETIVKSATGWRESADPDGLIADVAALVDSSVGLPAGQFSLAVFALRLFELQRDHGLYAAPEIVFPLLSLLGVEGTIRELDPGIDFQAAARPILSEALFGLGSVNRP
jgi:ubiquinone biosynthesis protein